MPIRPLTDLSDPVVSPYRIVREPQLAEGHGLFVAEGRLVVERLITMRTHRVRSVLVSPATLQALEPVLRELEPGVDVLVVSAEQMEQVAGFNLHRGCLALAERPRPLEPSDVIRAAQLVVILDAIRDADNVGSIFRNAAAFGAGPVLLGAGTCDPLYRKAIRTSMGATLQVPYAQCGRWPAELADLRVAGFTTMALSPRATLTIEESLAQVAPSAKLALIFGSEGAGISADVERAADVSLRIPISSAVDSLNVAVASGVVLHHFARHAGLRY